MFRFWYEAYTHSLNDLQLFAFLFDHTDDFMGQATHEKYKQKAAQ